MNWELHKVKPLWLLIHDGVAVETLHWDRDKSRYVNSAGISCGGSWPIARAAAEESAAKPKKAGVR